MPWVWQQCVDVDAVVAAGRLILFYFSHNMQK